MSKQEAPNPFLIFLDQLIQPLVLILIAAGIITAFIKDIVDASVILGVVILNAAIGFVQELKAQKAILALNKAVLQEATVVRDGVKRRLSSRDLVVGDVVILASGDRVPADIRLVRVRELQIDESMLTGESVPASKKPDVLPSDTPLADRLNMAYMGTWVTFGVGTGVVVATGDATEIGKINTLISKNKRLETPLTQKLARFSHFLLLAILGLAGVAFFIGLLRGDPLVDMVMVAVALAVGAIPEGLPAALTITLAIGVSKMAKRNAIVRKLPAVETLGSTSVICSDKTGTLTKNQMTVQLVYAADQRYAVTGVGYSEDGGVFLNEQAVNPGNILPLQDCLVAGMLCNDSSVVTQSNEVKIDGDPTEAALLVSGQKAGLELAEWKNKFPRLDAIPFESTYQYMATLHRNVDDGTGVIFVKGAFEAVLDRCIDTVSATGERVHLDKSEVMKAADALAGSGLRLLAFAQKQMNSDVTQVSQADLNPSLTFLGFQAMIDPPRSEAIAAVATCRRAGIVVKMITGDHVLTAVAIAKKIGIIAEDDGHPPQVLTGKQLEILSDSELNDRIAATHVFARVSPDQKLRLVQALQQRGEVVAMTGDGVNDAPSIHQANIGIAMGITGTDVAKETADMVITDDNFATIASAVEEGRAVYDNLVKFITWTLPTNFGLGIIILVAVALGVTLPILPIQILWINMTTAVLLGLMLAFEKNEPGTMQRKPRRLNQPILDQSLIIRIILVAGLLSTASFLFFHYALQSGRSIEEARTIAVNIFVFGELFYLFNCRSLHHSMLSVGVWSNPAIWIGVTIMTFVQIAFTYLPFMNVAFGSALIYPIDWAYIIATGLFIFMIVGIEKKIIKYFKFRNHKPHPSKEKRL